MNVNYLIISPDTATVAAGESQEYTARIYLHNATELEATPYVDFSIDSDAGGSWRFNTYTVQNPGTLIHTLEIIRTTAQKPP